MCSFNTNNVKILEEHVNEFHRPPPIRAVSDTSRKNIKLACCAWNKLDWQQILTIEMENDEFKKKIVKNSGTEEDKDSHNY